MTTDRQFLLPDLGEGLTGAEVLQWLVGVGDVVAVDQPVVVVETAKSTVELPSPFAGRVIMLGGAPGELISVGAPVLAIEEPVASDTEVAEAAPAEPEAVQEAPEHGRSEVDRPATAWRLEQSGEASDPIAAPSPSSVLVGYGLREAPPRPLREHHPVAVGPYDRLAEPAPTRAIRVISPVVRDLASSHGLDLATLNGSGPDGLILRGDVEQAIASLERPLERADLEAETSEAAGAVEAVDAEHREVTPAATWAPAPQSHAPLSIALAEELVEAALSDEPAAAATDAAEAEPATDASPRLIPIRGHQRAAIETLSRSRREIPEATVWVDVDATQLLEARRAIAGAIGGEPPSLVALLGRFCIEGLRRYPELNARVDLEANQIEILPKVHLGFAAETERGLVVPVVHDAETLTIAELARSIRQLVGAARAGTLPLTSTTGGTFTVNNYGVFGVDGSAAIINHPEVAIVGMGRIINRPWVVGDNIVARPVTQLTLAFDHRACDGTVAGGFLRFVADCVEHPVALLGEL